MKKLILLVAISFSVLTSCKKGGEPEPQIVTNTVTNTVHDTVNTTIHDTVNSCATILPLQGIWKLWKIENYTNSNLVSTDLHSDWIFTFGSTSLNKDLAASGNFNYPITYNTGSVDIYQTSTPTNYSVVNFNNGQEYKLIKFPGTGNYQIWYLRK